MATGQVDEHIAGVNAHRIKVGVAPQLEALHGNVEAKLLLGNIGVEPFARSGADLVVGQHKEDTVLVDAQHTDLRHLAERATQADHADLVQQEEGLPGVVEDV